MILKPGISGFGLLCESSVDDDIAAFKGACYAISCSELFSVISFDTVLLNKNFFVCRIQYNRETIYILLNRFCNYLCFANGVEYFKTNFIFVDRLAVKFSQYYRVLDLSEMNERITDEEKRQLNSDEVKQLNFHKSVTVGDVIFNYWD